MKRETYRREVSPDVAVRVFGHCCQVTVTGELHACDEENDVVAVEWWEVRRAENLLRSLAHDTMIVRYLPLVLIRRISRRPSSSGCEICSSLVAVDALSQTVESEGKTRGTRWVGKRIEDLPIKPAETPEGGVDFIWSVGGSYHNHVGACRERMDVSVHA